MLIMFSDDNNTNYDHIVEVINDPLVPVKILLFQELVKKLTVFLVLFLPDKPTILSNQSVERFD